MVFDIELCASYLYPNRDFWKSALDADRVVETDHILSDGVARAERLLHTLRDAPRAARLIGDMAFYAKINHPRVADMLCAVLLGRCLPVTLSQLRALGTGDAVLRDTFSDFGIWAREYEKLHGEYGMTEVGWVLLPYAHRVVRIGRMQYERAENFLPFFVYRHREEGTFAALSVPGKEFDTDGYALHSNERSAPHAFTAQLTNRDGALLGHPADLINGTALRQTRALNAAEWELALYPGQQILNLHIPADGPLTPKSVDDSLELAKSFFAQESYPIRYAMCESWLLDPHLENICKPESNIVSFMRRFYKLPIFSPASAIQSRIFGFDFVPEKLAEAAYATSLQRSLQAYLLGGGEVFDTGGFIAL